jgi:hypothetical protein
MNKGGISVQESENIYIEFMRICDRYNRSPETVMSIVRVHEREKKKNAA